MQLIYILLIAVFFTVPVNAQKQNNSVKKIDELITEFNSLYNGSKQLIVDFSTYSTNDNNELFYEFINEASSKEDYLLIYNDTPKFGVSDFGLKLVSDYNHNFGVGQPDEEVIYYKSRVSTGVDWVVFGEGSLLKNKKNQKINRLEVLKDSLENSLLKKEIKTKRVNEILSYIYDIQRLRVLNRYKSFLEEKITYTNNLYNAKLVSYAEKLKVLHDYDKIKNDIIFLNTYLVNVTKSDEIFFKYDEITRSNFNLPEMSSLEFEEFSNTNTKIIALQKEIYQNDTKNSDSPSFRTKFRYNFHNSNGSFDRNFASIGASLSIPIKFGKDQKKAYQLANLDTKLDIEASLFQEKLKKLKYDFLLTKNKQKELNNNFEYLKAVLDNELEVYKKFKKKFTPEKSIETAVKILKNELDLLDVNQKLSEYAIKFYYLYNESTDEPVNSNIQFSTYLWSKSFKETPNEKLINTLKDNKITLLFLSPGDTDIDKLQDFANLAKQNNILIHRLIGENSYVQDDLGYQKLLNKMKHIDKTIFSGIHLDIEPHTLEDYKKNTKSYTTKMNLIFLTAKQFCEQNNLKLGVSIPMHLPTENADFLKLNEIETYIMAYENINQNTLLKRTNALRSSLDGYYTWVIRLSDFRNTSELKIALKELKNQKFSKIGYYDLSALLKED